MNLLDPDVLADPDEFRRWLADLREAGLRGSAPDERAGVPHRTFWWVAEAGYLGRARLSLGLNDELAEFGGHIGFDVRRADAATPRRSCGPRWRRPGRRGSTGCC